MWCFLGESEGKQMKRKIIVLMMVGIMSLSAVACTHSHNTYTPSDDTANVQNDNSESNQISTTETENNAEGDELNKPDPEEEARKEKERQESLVVYADMINEIQTDFPEFTVNYIIGTDDGGKDMSINMPLLDSEDATTYKMAELVTTKETLLNNNGITDITIFVDNNKETAGIVMFSNEGGSYEPTVNTL